MEERIFNISVRNKLAKNLSKIFYVCGNSDYAAHFDFDAEWDAHPFKTARFIAGDGTHIDRIFSGDKCDVPVFMDTYQITVGVFAGNLRTTTPAIIPAKRSILSGGSAPAVPPKDDYAQMMEEINAAADRAENAADRAEEIAGSVVPGGGIDEEKLFDAVNRWDLIDSLVDHDGGYIADDDGSVLTIGVDLGELSGDDLEQLLGEVTDAAYRAEKAAARAEEIAGSIGPGGGGVDFEVDETLYLTNGVLGVNTSKAVEKDNTLPITSAAVYTEVGNINALLATI